MGHKKFTIGALAIFLIVGAVGVSACAPYTARVIGAAEPMLAQALVSDWQQVNSSGFGDPQTGEVTALEAFNGYLYAGTHNPIDPAPLFDGAQIFRSSDGVTWIPVTQPGFGNSHDIAPPAILDFIVFNNQLYAGTGRGNASQIWRTSNGTIWAPMDVTGFSDPDNVDITALAVYNGKIYAGVTNQVTGAQIWSSFTGDNNTWTQVAPTVPGNTPANVTGFAVFAFDDGLYAAVESESPAQIWRSYGGDWEVIVNDGFGDANTLLTGGMVEFGGQLYVGAGNTTDGAQLWRTSDATTWEQAITPGFGDPNNQQVETVFVFQSQLYIGVNNMATGLEIWRSADGTMWEQANLDGFGDSNNTSTNGSNATAEFVGQLYVGTLNVVDGGELWRTLLPNNPPTDISLSNSSVDENQPVNTVVGSLSATDPDIGPTFTFSLACTVPGVDDGSFNILGTDLRTSAVFDFETKSSYNICIRVTDQGGLFFDENFIISVNDLVENSAPTDISLSNASVDENQPVNTLVGTLSATDPDASATFTFSIACTVPGADDTSFNILGTELRTSAVFDFETKSSYNICIRVTDQGGLFFDENFIISVNDLVENSAPTDISLSNASVDENQPVNTLVGTLSATDPDAGNTFAFSLACAVPGADDTSFNILGTNLRTSAVFDFETKSSYNICIRVTDQGGLFFDESFVISVNDLVENSSPTDISLSNANVDENQPVNTVVGILSATDPDAGATFTFSLACAIPGVDDGSFNILGTDLRTSVVLDFETKSSYNICIRVTDQGGLFFDENFAITVNDIVEIPVNEAPTDIFLSNTAVDENQPVNTLVGTLSATDPDAGATFTFSLACAVPGADDGSFNILGTDLRTSAVFDFETKSSYNICIRVTDQGGLTFDENFVISVNDVVEDVNDAPTDISLSNSSVDENQPVNTLVGSLSATDPDPGATFTFSLACTVPGADDASFNILGTDLRTSAVLDFETKSSYNICIRVTDQGGLTFDENFLISVSDLDEVSNTPGKVNGGGVIALDRGGDRVTFGFTIQYDAGDSEPKGNLIYHDHKANLRLKVTSFDLLVIEGNHALFTGIGTVNDGQEVEFKVEIEASSRFDQADTFHIYIPALNEYKAGGSLTGGNITIH